jgi:hypothetical protein
VLVAAGDADAGLVAAADEIRRRLAIL